MNDLIKKGEAYRFGIKEVIIEQFLVEWGFSLVYNASSAKYKREYFQGINKGRAVCSLLYFAHAIVE